MTAGARQRLLDALEILEALRPAAERAIGGADPEDDPIRQAWDRARREAREAAAEWGGP